MRLPSIQRRHIYWLGLILALGLILYLFARPAYRYVRERRLDANLEKAVAAASAKDWGTTRNLARSVLLGRRGDFQAFRLWFQALSALSEPRTYTVAIELFMHPKADLQDKLAAFKVLCNQAPQAVALGAYAFLPEETRNLTDFRAAIVPLLLLRGEVATSENLLRAAPEIKFSATARLELIRTLCASPSSARVQEARQLFADLIRENASEGLEALLILGGISEGLAPGSPLPPLPAWVNSRPEALALHHLQALNPDIQSRPVGAEGIYYQAIERFLATDPSVLGTWLISHGRSAQVVTLLEKSSSVDAGAYIARLHAMMKEGMTIEINAALASPPPSVDLVELELVRAALAHQRKDLTVEKVAWDRVLQQAAFDQTKNRFLEIIRFATLLGAKNVADDATVAAVRIGWGRIPLYRDLLPVLARLAKENRTEDLLAIYKTLMRFESNNPSILNDYLYLGLLHRVITPADALKQLEALQASRPEMREIQSAIAFSSLLNGNPVKVLEIIPALKQDKRIPATLVEALEGAAQLASGQFNQGQLTISKIDWSLMLVQESIVLRDYLVRLNIKNLALPELPSASIKTNASSETPAWRRVVEALEKNRSGDILPALPAPQVPVYTAPEQPSPPSQTPAK